MHNKEMSMVKTFITATLAFCLPTALAAQAAEKAQAPAADKQKSEVATAVSRMARVGSANSPSFSPDGKWVSFISNMSGSPQVWVAPAQGGYPRMVTNGDDPVIQAYWSPASDWVAVPIAPG